MSIIRWRKKSSVRDVRTDGQKLRNPDTIVCAKCGDTANIISFPPDRVLYKCHKCGSTTANPDKKDAVKNQIKSAPAPAIIIRDCSKDSAATPKTPVSTIGIESSPLVESNKKIIRKAMEETRILSFQYEDLSRRTTIRNVEPYKLCDNIKTGEVVVFAFCVDSEAIRSFKLSCMVNCMLQEFKFTPKYPIEDKLTT